MRGSRGVQQECAAEAAAARRRAPSAGAGAAPRRSARARQLEAAAAKLLLNGGHGLRGWDEGRQARSAGLRCVWCQVEWGSAGPRGRGHPTAAHRTAAVSASMPRTWSARAGHGTAQPSSSSGGVAHPGGRVVGAGAGAGGHAPGAGRHRLGLNNEHGRLAHQLVPQQVAAGCRWVDASKQGRRSRSLAACCCCRTRQPRPSASPAVWGAGLTSAARRTGCWPRKRTTTQPS